jgi:hypothetical protein
MDTKTPSAEFFDASVFLGMNSDNDSARIACKNFFASRLQGRVYTSFEQVGACDDVIWRYTRYQQDIYYPFMDLLHSIARIERQPCTNDELARVADPSWGNDLEASDRLLISKVAQSNGCLYSLRSRFRSRDEVAVITPSATQELAFPDPLESLYRASLNLRLRHSELCQ